MIVPVEICLEISKYLDRGTKHKLYTLINYNICCSLKNKLTNFNEPKDLFYIFEYSLYCCVCDKYVCDWCSDESFTWCEWYDGNGDYDYVSMCIDCSKNYSIV
jgi:hypothetical protein